VTAFLAAIDRLERNDLAFQFSMLIVAQRGDGADIKQIMKELAR